ncbi:MAG TPA: RHS repeat-associated core domain-containing protein, partial [Caulobacteraceae bacterium]|nr:RHS repeat-associated core domain-containing protein [Caulobacteraceae bacterium]
KPSDEQDRRTAPMELESRQPPPRRLTRKRPLRSQVDAYQRGPYETLTVSDGTTTYRDYIKADGALVVVRLTQGSSITLQYVVSDHLGSATVVTDSSGNVLQRLSYDAWGMRRNPDGTVPVNPITGIITRGFTGEEMMDDVGLINFNARLYDPQLGRFLAADPAMRNEYLDKLLDRYGYVGDNPLSLTDPSGLCFISCTFDEILGIVVAIALPELLPELEFPGVSGEALTAAMAAHPFLVPLNLGISGGLSGFISTGNLKGALLGSAEALAFYGVGGELRAARFTGKTEFYATRFVAHGLVGGLFTVAEGGNFGSGFLAGGVGSLAPAPTTGQELTFDVLAEGTAESAVLGGIGSVLGGGKFESGAVTGAFGYLFNEIAHRGLPTGRYTPGQLRNVLYNEAASMRPNDLNAGVLTAFEWEQLQLGYDAIADVAVNRNLAGAIENFGSGPGATMANYDLTQQAAAAVAQPGSIVNFMYSLAKAAAQQALVPESDITGGALHYTVGGPARVDLFGPVTVSFGPFTSMRDTDSYIRICGGR